MPEKTSRALYSSLPYLAGLFVILFLTAFLPSLYVFDDLKIFNLVVRALLLAGMPFLYIPFIYWIS
ncbi:MAG: hypothetical protein R3220_07460, partial [Balneolaceae bacterium]|nr:hypothetical protein [Balneolaceae bacterium]